MISIWSRAREKANQGHFEQGTSSRHTKSPSPYWPKGSRNKMAGGPKPVYIARMGESDELFTEGIGCYQNRVRGFLPLRHQLLRLGLLTAMI